MSSLASIGEDAAVPPPSKLLLALELRALPGLAQFCAAWPVLNALVPRGDGHCVLVLPGLTMSDRSTVPLRALLAARGYDAHGWGLGLNHGPRPGIPEAMIEAVERLADRSRRKVSLVGWSLGGIYARQLARLMPERVRAVVTLASPFNGDPRATNAWRLYERRSGLSLGEGGGRLGGSLAAPLPVPSSAIFSRTDGICAWKICRERKGDMAESIEVRASHCGLGHHPSALFAVGDRLAQPEGAWRPFDRGSFRRLFFPDPNRE